MDFFRRLFDTTDFPSRWHCGQWTAGHGWLHIISDIGVWSAYLAIPIILGIFVIRRRDLPFKGIFILFAMFILSCGTTHLMEATIFWWPAYRLAAVIKAFTAVISWATVLALIPITPRLLSLRSSEELEKEIIERKRVEQELNIRAEELNQKNQQLAENERLKSEFLANMSHEIRTPMHGMLGMLDLALDTELSTEQRRYVETVKSSADSLLSILNDILDFSKIEAGKLEMNAVEFRLPDTIGDVLMPLAVRAHQKQLELAYHVSPDVPDDVIGDPDRLKQILINLVGNALKFTEYGEVVLNVKLDGPSPDPRKDTDVRLHFSVRDTGIGIPKEKLAAVFESFTQVDGSTSRRYGGSGLGLTICKKLVKLMHGNVWVESEVNKGTTFHFTAVLKRCMNPTAPAVPKSAEELRGLPVLVVDDNATNREILGEMLTSWELKPQLVDSGPGGLELLRQAAASGHPYPLIILDVMMPDMDGFTVVEQIRDDPRLTGTIILMLSSIARMLDLARCRELGVSSHMMKPIRQSDLFNTIRRALAAPGTLPWEPPPVPRGVPDPTADTLPRLRVLLAEDNIINQRLAVGLLEKRGHSVVVASDGNEALDFMQRERFDVVLMDIQMPVMDGFEAVAIIREKDKQMGGHTPVIALTANALKGDRQRCLDGGFDEYISKPINVRQLFAILNAILAPKAKRDESKVRFPRGESPVRAAILAHTEGDEDLAQQVISLFLKSLPRLVANIEAALASKDVPGLVRAAHSLKGSLASFGASEAFTVVVKLEEAAIKSQLTRVKDLVPNMHIALERLKAEFGAV